MKNRLGGEGGDTKFVDLGGHLSQVACQNQRGLLSTVAATTQRSAPLKMRVIAGSQGGYMRFPVKLV